MRERRESECERVNMEADYTVSYVDVPLDSEGGW